MPIQIKSTVQLRNPGSPQNPPHLYFVITEPDEESKVLLVNITENEEGRDQSCVLQPREHPYIRKESVVNYREAILSDVQKIEVAISMQVATPDANMSDALLDKVIQGGKVSPFLKKDFKNLL
jgi:hypothetical protein